MPIPNFTDDERRAFMEVVLQLEPGDLEFITVLEFGEPLKTYSSSVNKMPVIVLEFTTWIAEDVTKLCKFLDYICKNKQNLPQCGKLQAHKQRLTALASKAAVAPPDALIIDSQVMVNRNRLRYLLRRLTEGAIIPVISVIGPPSSGRSHSWHLIRHVAENHNIDPLLVDLISWVPEDRTLANMFGFIVDRLGLVDIEEPTTTGAQDETVGLRYAVKLAEAMDRQSDGKTHWIVFDSIDRSMSYELAVFIRCLCQLRNEAAFRECTIFTLGESSQIDLSEGLIQNEDIAPFLQQELSEAFYYVNEFGVKPLPNDQLDERCKAVWDQVNHLPNEEVARHISRVLTELRQEVEAL